MEYQALAVQNGGYAYPRTRSPRPRSVTALWLGMGAAGRNRGPDG
jgi:hypothetical protein